jgi:hypothetical protein
MSFWLAAIHVSNFLAPALGVGLLLALLELIFKKKKVLALSFIGSFAQYFGVGAAILLFGLAWLGRDGKMLTYAALVLCTAALGAWRHRA